MTKSGLLHRWLNESIPVKNVITPFDCHLFVNCYLAVEFEPCLNSWSICYWQMKCITLFIYYSSVNFETLLDIKALYAVQTAWHRTGRCGCSVHGSHRSTMWHSFMAFTLDFLFRLLSSISSWKILRWLWWVIKVKSCEKQIFYFEGWTWLTGSYLPAAPLGYTQSWAAFRPISLPMLSDSQTHPGAGIFSPATFVCVENIFYSGALLWWDTTRF